MLTPDGWWTPRFELDSGYPSVGVRAGTTRDGLRIGVQIVARPWQDHVGTCRRTDRLGYDLWLAAAEGRRRPDDLAVLP